MQSILRSLAAQGNIYRGGRSAVSRHSRNFCSSNELIRVFKENMISKRAQEELDIRAQRHKEMVSKAMHDLGVSDE